MGLAGRPWARAIGRVDSGLAEVVNRAFQNRGDALELHEGRGGVRRLTLDEIEVGRVHLHGLRQLVQGKTPSHAEVPYRPFMGLGPARWTFGHIAQRPANNEVPDACLSSPVWRPAEAARQAPAARSPMRAASYFAFFIRQSW